MNHMRELLGVACLAATCVAQTGSATELTTQFRTAYASPDCAHRKEAVEVLARSTEAVGGLVASRDVALALASALSDEDDDVALAAIEGLKERRHAPAAAEALGKLLGDLGRRIRDIIQSTDGWAVIDRLEKPKRNYVAVCSALGGYRRRESLQALAKELKFFADFPPGRKLFGHCEEALVDGLLQLGTQGAVDAVVQHLRSYYLKSQRDWLVSIHLRLRSFCDANGLEPVDFPEDIAGAWRDWYTKNRGRLPKSLDQGQR